MITVRKSADRGHFDHGWLDTYHTFSFAHYFDPEQMGFRTLRVINEDRVAPGKGFGSHPHEDMEIITVVLEGEIEHRDNMGNGGILRSGEVQTMSAGRGIVHSEFNPSKTEPLHLLQIWLVPERRGLTPRYQSARFELAQFDGRACLLVSNDGAGESLPIQQDARIYRSRLAHGQPLEHSLENGRHAWVQAISGELLVNDVALSTGDGAAISEVSQLTFSAESEADFLLFDLA